MPAQIHHWNLNDPMLIMQARHYINRHQDRRLRSFRSDEVFHPGPLRSLDADWLGGLRVTPPTSG